MALSIGLLAGGQVWVETGVVSWALAVGAGALVVFAVAWRMITSRYHGARLVLFGHRLSGHAVTTGTRSNKPGHAGDPSGGEGASAARPAAALGEDARRRTANPGGRPRVRPSGDPPRAESTETAAEPTAPRPGRRPRRGS